MIVLNVFYIFAKNFFMKQYITTCTVLLLTCAFLTCTKRSENSILLEKAYDYMSINSDSTKILLEKIGADAGSLGRYDNMKFKLLSGLIQNTYDIPFVSDSLYLEVKDYFDRNGNDNERLKANYVLGCVYRDLGDASKALFYYNEAVNAADTTSTDCDYRTMSKVYGQMAEIFHKQYIAELELEYELKAVSSAVKSKDSLNATIFYERLADAYALMGINDSIIAISENASKIYKSLGYEQMAARALYPTINIYQTQGQHHKAWENIKTYMNCSGVFNKDGSTMPGHEVFYNYIANYYLQTGRNDSARYYFEKALQNADNLLCYAFANKGLMNLALEERNIEKVAKYAQHYCEAEERRNVQASQESITRLQKLYNYNRIQLQNTQVRKKYFRLQKSIILILFCSVILMSLLYSFYKRKEQGIRNELIEKNADYVSILTQYNNANADYERYKTSQEKYITEKCKEIDRLKEKLSLYYNCDISRQKWNEERDLYDNKHIIELHMLAQKGKIASNEELSIAKTLVESTLQKYRSYIEACSSITEKERIICALIRLRFVPSEISLLLSIKPNSLTNIRSTINKKLFKTNGTKNLDFNIRLLS